MKKLLFSLMLLAFCSAALAQADEALVTRLKEKYPGSHVSYRSWNHGGYYLVFHNDSAWICDLTGKEIIAPGKYTNVFLLDGCFGVCIGDKQGICNLAGKEIIPPEKYTNVYLYDGNYYVKIGDKAGVCDLNGREIFAPGDKYTSVFLRAGYYSVKSGDEEGVCNLNGKEIIAPGKYTNIVLHKGYYGVKRGDKEGVCDLNGKEIIAPGKYTNLFLAGTAPYHYYSVSIGDKEGACDLNGTEVVPCEYAAVVYSSGKFRVRYSKGGDFIALNDVTLNPDSTALALIISKTKRGNSTVSTAISTPDARPVPGSTQKEQAAGALALAKEYDAKKDYVTAARYYKEAAEGNNAEAQFALALKYSLGEGVEISPQKCEMWMKSAASNGNSGAQFAMGLAMESVGVYTDALFWYRQAAQQGNAVAKGMMDNLLNRLGSNSGQTMQNNPYGSSGAQQYNNNRQNTRVLCSYCNGTGKKCQLKTVPTYGNTSRVRHRCNNCQELLPVGTVHVQVKCPHCQGRGYREY